MPDISNLTYGRNLNGSNQIIQNLIDDIKTITTALSGPEYDAIVREVQNNWSGTDATAFLTKFDNSTKELRNYYNSFMFQIGSTISTDYGQFVKQQRQMADSINSTIKKIY